MQGTKKHYKAVLGDLIDTMPSYFEIAMNRHLNVSYLLVQALLPDMKVANYGRIVNILSTDGTETGKIVGAIASQQFKKVSLELGGKNPNIIFADCNLDEAVKTSVKSSFTNQGEICLCSSRIFIEDSIYNEFKTRFLEEFKKLVIGDSMNRESNLGAPVSEDHLNKADSYIYIKL